MSHNPWQHTWNSHQLNSDLYMSDMDVHEHVCQNGCQCTRMYECEQLINLTLQVCYAIMIFVFVHVLLTIIIATMRYLDLCV